MSKTLTPRALLRRIGPPYVYNAIGGRTMMVPVAYRAPGIAVRKLRGRKTGTYAGFIHEIGAALQFPVVFGENWSATEELLQFMDEWTPGDGFTLVIEDASHLLAQEPAELATFARILARVGTWWSQPIDDGTPFERPAKAFHVVLESPGGELLEALAQAGLEVVDLPLKGR